MIDLPEEEEVLNECLFLTFKEALNVLNLTYPLLNKRHRYICSEVSKLSKFGYFYNPDLFQSYNNYNNDIIDYTLGTVTHDQCYGSRVYWDDVNGKRWNILNKYPLCWLYISKDELLSQITAGVELAKINSRNKRLSGKSENALKRKRAADLKEKALSKLTKDEQEALLGKPPKVGKSRR